MPRGEDSWLEDLYRAEYARLVIFLRSRVGSLAAAEDLAQDTFHEALRHKQELMAHPNPQGWLLRTAKNKVMHWESERIRYLRLFVSMEDTRELPAKPEDSGKELLLLIRQGLEPEEYDLFLRLALEGKSHLEVSRELGISVWGCQKRMSRIKAKLEKLFPQE